MGTIQCLSVIGLVIQHQLHGLQEIQIMVLVIANQDMLTTF